MKEEKMLIKITNKGAGIGLAMFSSALLGLVAFHNSHPKKKTLVEYRDDLYKNLEKMIKWSERENDGTISDRNMAKSVKDAEETLKIVKNLWKI